MLDGVRILDLSNIIAAPSAGRLLAEHGADVTHVYSPTSAASPLVTLHFGIEVHRGKRSTIIDLKSAAGARAFAALVKRADVVLHNFLDGAAERLGITQAQLREINPQVVSCQVTSNGGGVRTGTLRRCAQPVLRRSGPWGSNRHLEAVCAAGAQKIGPDRAQCGRARSTAAMARCPATTPSRKLPRESWCGTARSLSQRCTRSPRAPTTSLARSPPLG